MNRNARSFVVIMLVVAFVALFLRFFIEQLIKINIKHNETYAQETIKLISIAFENYAKDHQGIYPVNYAELLDNKPAYIEKKYVPTVNGLRGYNYSCSRLESSGYSCSVTAKSCDFSGKKSFVVSTGGAIVSEDCGKKKL